MNKVIKFLAATVIAITASFSVTTLATNDSSVEAGTCYYNSYTGKVSGGYGSITNLGNYGSPDCYNHRAKVRCSSSGGSYYDGYGPWRGAGQTSTRFCLSGYTATNVWNQKTWVG